MAFAARPTAGDPVPWFVARSADNPEVHFYARRAAAAGVRAIWFREVGAKGIDGQKLAAEAQALIAKYGSK